MILTSDIADHHIGAIRPDVLIQDKKKKTAMIIDVTPPSDVNVVSDEYEKVSKNSGLRVEVEKMWNVEAKVVPTAVRSLVSNNLMGYLKEVPGSPSITGQKIAVFGSEKKFLDPFCQKAEMCMLLRVPLVLGRTLDANVGGCKCRM